MSANKKIKTSKIFVFDTQSGFEGFVLQYQFKQLQRNYIQRIVKDLQTNNKPQDKIYVYCFSYRSALRIRTAKFVYYEFSKEQFDEFSKQLKEKYRYIHIYTVKGETFYAEEIATKLRK